MPEQSIRVLIVDDEPQIRRLLRVSLAAQGYTVSETALGCEALTRVAADHPDCCCWTWGCRTWTGRK